jgi:mycothiol synthase
MPSFYLATDLLYMVWPPARTSPPVVMPPGYRLRLYREEDAAAYCALANLDGWQDTGWRCSERTLRDMLVRVLPRGFFLVEEIATGALVATATARHRPNADTYDFPFGGEICLVFVHPEHRQRGLGRAMTAVALHRLVEVGYPNIYLNTTEERIPALRLYFGMGFTPLLYTADVTERWRAVCVTLGQPFTPELWPEQAEHWA